MIPCSCFIWQAQKRASVTPCAVDLERVMGIEPTFKAWEALVLPLNYTRWGLLSHQDLTNPPFCFRALNQ